MTLEEWNVLEQYFRRYAGKWIRLQADLYRDGIGNSAEQLLIAAKDSPLEFEVAWRKRFNVNAIDLAEDFKDASPLFRLPGSLLKDALKPTRGELRLARQYTARGTRYRITDQAFGADVLVWHPMPFGSEGLLAVQVKRYASKRKVGIKDLFELHGAVTHYHADSGQVVTTSDFSNPAKTFASANRYQLVDYKRLQAEILRLF